MHLNEIVEKLSAEVLMSGRDKSRMVDHTFSSDLMSDVLTRDYQNTFLINGLSNVQSIPTAEITEIYQVIIGRNKDVNYDLISLAENSGIVFLKCPFSLFRISGIL